MSRWSAKHVLFFVLALMTLFVVYRNERFFFNHQSDTWKFFYPVRWKLFVHALGGATALVLGALQFSTKLRQSHPAVIELSDVFIGGVLVAAPLAVYLSFTHGLRTLSVETAVQATLWALTTLTALRAALNRSFETHQQWMMRSYAVTLIFVVSRILYVVPILEPTRDIDAERILWILNICALLVPQMIINRRQLFTRTGR
jgi:Predicted membrane protein (DUF2306)